jgi:hypothetical protein
MMGKVVLRQLGRVMRMVLRQLRWVTRMVMRVLGTLATIGCVRLLLHAARLRVALHSLGVRGHHRHSID